MTRPIVAEQYLADLIAEQDPRRPLEQSFYSEPEIYERDLEHVFMRSWLYVCHLSQIPSAGDFMLFEVGGESVIVVRNQDGEVQGLINVCRHRGSRVCVEKKGHAKVFVCPYHAWSYDLDGKLRAARYVADDFDKAEHGLKRVHVEVFHGLVFINFSREPASLDRARAELEDVVRPYQLEQTKVAHSETYSVDANWKLAMENYMECYHCAVAHPEYSRSHSLQLPPELVADQYAEMLSHANEVGLSRETVKVCGANVEPFGTDSFYCRQPLLGDYKTGSEDGEPVAPLLGTIKGYDKGAADLQVGALNFLLLYSDHAVVYRFTPTAPQRTEMGVSWLVREDAEEGVDYDINRLTWLWHITSKADKEIINLNQQGVNSRFYEPGPYSTMEGATSQFIEWYLAAIK